MKPPYRVPLMDEIRALPSNGFTVASTFSGCGGSSLGYRMAGFRVLWASEFIPAAQDSYRANKADYTILDTRDIREVSAGDILKATGKAQGELDLFDGSPPCSAFSSAGSREAGWNKAKAYSDGAVQRVDDLFYEYARLVKGLQPKTFIAENVSGLVKGTAKGYFLRILAELKSCGYHVEARLLDASWLGVPQARQRLIFAGVRSDLKRTPAFPAPLAFRYTVQDALPWIRRIEGGNGFDGHAFYGADKASNTIQASRALMVEAETDISRYAIGAEWEKMGRPGTQSEKYFQLVRPSLDRPCPTITQTAGSGSAAGVTHPTEKRKFSIAELKRLCGFPDDFVLTGTYRQQWERCGRAVPPVMMSYIAAAVRDGVLCRL